MPASQQGADTRKRSSCYPLLPAVGERRRWYRWRQLSPRVTGRADGVRALAAVSGVFSHAKHPEAWHPPLRNVPGGEYFRVLRAGSPLHD